jgi:hypothetical protein
MMMMMMILLSVCRTHSSAANDKVDADRLPMARWPWMWKRTWCRCSRRADGRVGPSKSTRCRSKVHTRSLSLSLSLIVSVRLSLSLSLSLFASLSVCLSVCPSASLCAPCPPLFHPPLSSSDHPSDLLGSDHMVAVIAVPSDRKFSAYGQEPTGTGTDKRVDAFVVYGLPNRWARRRVIMMMMMMRRRRRRRRRRKGRGS